MFIPRVAIVSGLLALALWFQAPAIIDDIETKTFDRQRDRDAPKRPTAWLPTARVATAWQAMVTGQPFDK